MSLNIQEKLSVPILIIIFFVILSLGVLMPIVKMIILGAILALVVRPISKRIETKINNSTFSNVLGMFIILIPLLLVLFFLLYQIVDILASIFAHAGGISSFNLHQNIISNAPSQYSSLIQTISYMILDSSTNLLKTIFKSSVDFLTDIPDLLVKILVLAFSTFYFARDGDKCWDYIFLFVPEDQYDFFNKMFAHIKDVLKSIFYGHFLTSIIIGIFAYIGYGLLGYPYPVFLGILTGVFQLIPILGPLPIYLTLAIIDLYNGNYPRIVLVFIVGLFLSNIDIYIRPAIAGKYAEIHPLILLLGFAAGPLVLGIVGFILGPLILGVAFAVINTFKEEKESKLIE